MPSPFSGMDPYIEACRLWEDFHDNLIGDIQRELAERLPTRYVVRSGERSYIVLEPRERDEEYSAQSDVAVLVGPRSKRAAAILVGTAILEDMTTEPPPLEMEAFVESEYRESYLEISAVEPRRKLVTTIEVLSPSNKRPGTTGWILYNRKRQAHIMGRASLVEIDLLRSGRRMFDEWPDSLYYLLVSRKGRGTRCMVWAAHFLRPLPVIPIPLAAPDPDIPLAIQPLVERIYDRSRYAMDIDYRAPCRPALSPSESSWLQKQLRERKKRK